MTLLTANSFITTIARTLVANEDGPRAQAALADRCGNLLYEKRYLDAAAPFTTITPSHYMKPRTGAWSVSARNFHPSYILRVAGQGAFVMLLESLDPAVQEYVLKPLGWEERRTRC